MYLHSFPQLFTIIHNYLQLFTIVIISAIGVCRCKQAERTVRTWRQQRRYGPFSGKQRSIHRTEDHKCYDYQGVTVTGRPVPYNSADHRDIQS